MTEAERLASVEAARALTLPPAPPGSLHHVFHDADGWCTGARMSEGPASLLTGGAAVVPEVCRVVMDIPQAFHYRAGQVTCHQDDRQAWQHLRHALPADRVRGALQQLRDHRGAVSAGVPSDVVSRPPRPRGAEPFPGLPWSPPGMPDLVVRELTHADLYDVTTQAMAQGTETERCPGEVPCCQPPEAHAWLTLADRILPDTRWAFCVTYKGQPIQFEILEQWIPPVSVVTHHLAPERPMWFWRELWRPIVDGLRVYGHREVLGAIRADLTDFLLRLGTEYGATPAGRFGNGAGQYLRYDLAAIPFAGFPARQTVPGWQWTAPGDAAVEVREIDLTTATAEITRLWTQRGTPHAPTNMAEALRIVTERWPLDRATILGGFVQGACWSVVCLSPRGAGVVGQATCTPFLAAPRSGLLQWGFMRWCQAAGYATISAWWPAYQIARHEAGTARTRFPWTVRRRRATHVEMTADIETVLARPEAEWSADLTGRP